MPLTFKLNVLLMNNWICAEIQQVAKEAYAEVMGPTFEVMLTSGLDGAHDPKSGHYQGRALDFRTGHHWETPLMTKVQAQQVVDAMKRRLGKQFTVFLESDHIHSQRNLPD